jgi:hypothetical protein
MFGVGFDREQDGNAPVVAAQAGPALNPFLNLTDMADGNLPRSYLLGSGRIELGATADGTFTTVALQQTTNSTGVADWSAPTACLTVTSVSSPQCGSLLVDTGLDYAIVQVPDAAQPPTDPPGIAGQRPTLATGVQVSIALPGKGAPVLYHFTVGGPGAPKSVEWGHNIGAHSGSSFFNISRYALGQFDYLFDATAGRLSFRPVPAG